MPGQEHDSSDAVQAAPQRDGSGAPPPAPRRRHWALLGILVVAALGAALYWGVPYVRAYFTTVSTDDAYVNAHVTYVAPRIQDNVVEVLVEETEFVEPGTVLVKLDPYPYQLAVEQRQAALDVARAQLEQTVAKVRAQEAQGRAAWFQLIAAQEQVRAQLATLRANLAGLREARANLTYARSEVERVRRLVPTGAATAEELEQRRNALRVAESRVTTAEETVQQTRAALGLGRDDKSPLKVPPKLEENFSAVQIALSNAAMALAQIGMRLQLHNLTPEKLHKQLEDLGAGHDINSALDRLVEKSPDVLYARAHVQAAEKDLAQAELNLSYTVIRSDVAGFVGRRNVNPGDHVQPGQNLMTVRSFTDVWIDANFKETQLKDIRIGQPVDIEVDAYPGRVFKGRVAGFSPATGAVAALLPPENATGNFVKIVQRLPVRIELTEPNPADTPLFAGLSVVPTVRIKEQPTGPNAGKRIQDEWKSEAPADTTAPPRPNKGKPEVKPARPRS